MARYHRGAQVRYICTRCTSGWPPAFYTRDLERHRQGKDAGTTERQLSLPFEEGVANLPPMLLQAALVEHGPSTDQGTLVRAVALPWLKIASLIETNPEILQQMPWERIEELVAGAYKREGWDEVTITPRSGDGGRDIIAVRRGICTIRIIDQVKAYAPGRRVTANDVRALLGVLSSDLNVSKGIVTTTAEFAPRIRDDNSIKPFVPYRLELKDGVRLRRWLLDVARRGRAAW